MITGRPRRLFLAGLALSALLHLTLLSRGWIIIPAWTDDSDPAPIEARLMLPPRIAPAPPPPVAAVKPVRATPPRRAVVAPVEAAPVAAAPDPEPVAQVVPLETSVAEPPEPPAMVEPAPSEPPAMVEPALAEPVQPESAQPEPVTPANPLPRRVTLEYRARYGLASGKQLLLWVNEGEHYTITSVATASGLASLVFSGQLVQTSRGRITAQGLQPEEFWDQRGDTRRHSRFDYAAHTILSVSAKGARTLALPDGVQDAQSLLFQIALTAPPAIDSGHAVFNGKKVRSYRYRVIGEETLDTPLGAMRALRIVRQTERDAERFEVWLALDRYYLPLKLATEISGYDAELMVQSIAIED